ncbi:SseB family protein [Anatilimnocola sp. NA78]|uniref:SseB family protein n=1 Tax=Anatilimnocola sp. NA78 TaxID=3415683 RepID=UPI003CE5C0D6
MEFASQNGLEDALIKASLGSLSVAEFLAVLLESDIHLLSSTVIGSDGGGFRPLLFEKEDGSYLAVFTDKLRIQGFAQDFSYCLTMNGRSLFLQFPTGFGMVINPKCDFGLEVPPQGVADIKRDFL